MRAYVATTGSAFVLILLAHVARVVVEGWQVALGPAFIVSSLISAGLCIWSLQLWKSLRTKVSAMHDREHA